MKYRTWLVRSLWFIVLGSMAISACGGAGSQATDTPVAVGTNPSGVGSPTAVSQGGGNPTQSSSTEPVKIGVPFPLSGSLASAGADSKAAVEVAVDVINNSYDLNLLLARGQGLPNLNNRPVEAVFADHAMDPQKAQSETERLITQEGVVAINGAWASSTTATASQVAERLGIPFLNSNSTSPALGERGFKWYFRTTPTDDVFVRNMFDFMKDMVDQKGTKIQTIAILHEDTAFGTDTADKATTLAQQAGFDVVANIAYPQNATDVTSEVQRLKAANPDVLIQADYASNAILSVLAYKQFDFNPAAIIANDNGFIDQQYTSAVGDSGNYIFSRDLWSTDWVTSNAQAKAINDLYHQKTGKDLTGTSARAFMGFLILADAINRAGSTDPEAIRQALLDTSLTTDQLIMPWPGVKFDPQTHENTLGTGIVVQMQGGKYYTVWPFDVAAKDPIWPMPAWSSR